MKENLLNRIKIFVKKIPFLIQIAILVFLLGFIVMSTILVDSDCAAYAATELTVGKGFVFSSVCLLVFLFSSPFRCKNIWITSIHAFVCGFVCRWLLFVILSTNLTNRFDQLWIFTIVFFLSVVAIKAFLGDFITYIIASFLLKINPSGRLLISFFAATWNTKSIKNSNKYLDMFLSVFHKGKKFLGFSNPRSYPVEKAVQDNLESKFIYVRNLLIKEEFSDIDKINKAFEKVVVALSVELSLYAVVINGSKLNVGKEIALESTDTDVLFERVLSVWSMIVLLKQKTQNESYDEIAISFINELVCFFHEFSDLNDKTDLLEECQNSWSKIEYQKVFQRLENIQEIDCLPNRLAILIYADIFLLNNLHIIVINLSNELLNLKNRMWLIHSINRTKKFAESELLKCQANISENATVSIYKIEHYIASNNSDNLDEQIDLANTPDVNDEIPAAIKDYPQKFDWAKEVLQEPIPRDFINLGLDKLVSGFVVSCILAFVCFDVVTILPIGKPTKVLIDIHRNEKYNDFTITTADALPDEDKIFIGTNGGGIHQINTSNFRITTEKSSDKGLASNWIHHLAVASDSSLLAAVTNNPSKNPIPAVGVSYKDKEDNWSTFISPNSVMGLKGEEFTSVIGLKGIKVLAVSGKLLSYDDNIRELRELVIEHPSPVGAEEQVAKLFADSSSEDSFLMLTTLKEQTQLHSAYLAKIISSDSVKLEKLYNKDLENNISEAGYENSIVQVRTNDNQLFRHQDGSWEYICGNFPDIDVERIVNVSIKTDPLPAIWIITNANKKSDSKIYMCVLDNNRILPTTPWGIGDLFKGVRCDDDTVVCMDDLQLSNSLVDPLIRWNESKRRYELLIQGKEKDWFLFLAPSFPVSDISQTEITCKRINTFNQQIKWFDANDDHLITVMYDNASKTRSIAEWNWDNENGLALANEIQKTAVGDFLKEQSILAVISKANQDGFFAICKSGIVLEYSKKLRGWLDTGNVEIVTEEGVKPKQIVSASSNYDNTVYLLDKDNQIFKLDFPEENIIDNNICCKLIHTPSENRPDGNTKIKRIATEDDGIILFVEKENKVFSWCFQTIEANNHLFCWTQEKTPTELSINIDSVTRLQNVSKKGCLLALDSDGNLMYRVKGQWLLASGKTEKWNDILNVLGGTFVTNDNGIAMVSEDENSSPTVKDWCWERSSLEKLTLPLHDIAAVYDDNGHSKLLIGSLEGLNYYDPENHKWQAIKLEHSAIGQWKFYQNKIGKSVWAIQKVDSNCYYCLVDYNNVKEFYKENIKAITPAGNGLFVEFHDKSIMYANSSGVEKTIVPAIRKELDNGMIAKTCKKNDRELVALTTEGKIFSISNEDLNVKSFDTKSIAGKVIDISCLSDGTLLAVDDKRNLYCKRYDSSVFELKSKNYFSITDKINEKYAIAAETSDSRLEICNASENIVVTSGKTNWPTTGLPATWFVDDDYLYISGSKGAAKHSINDSYFTALEACNGITRFEKQANSIIGWKNNVPYILKDKAFVPIKGGSASANGYNLINTPEGLGIFNKSECKYYFVQNEKQIPIFKKESDLGGSIKDAVALSQNITALKAENNSLVCYNHSNHNYLKVSDAANLNDNWRFIQLNDETFVASENNDGLGKIFKIRPDCTLNQIAKSVREVYRAPQCLYWLTDDFQIGSYKKGETTLVSSNFVGKRAETTTEVININNKLLCRNNNGNAFVFDVNSGKAISKASNIWCLGKINNTAVGFEKSGNTYGIRRLDNNEKINNENFTSFKQGDNNILCWKENNGGTKFELFGKKNIAGEINTIPAAMSSQLSSTEWLTIGNKIFAITAMGQLCCYDFDNIKWSLFGDNSRKYSEIGLFNNKIIAVSQINEERLISIISPNDFKIEKEIKLNGQFIFSEKDYITQKSENDKLYLNVENLNGDSKNLSVFQKDFAGFNYNKSFAIQLSNDLIFAYLPDDNIRSCNTYLFKKGLSKPLEIINSKIQDIEKYDSVVKFDGSKIYLQPSSRTEYVAVIDSRNTSNFDIKYNKKLESEGNKFWLRDISTGNSGEKINAVNIPAKTLLAGINDYIDIFGRKLMANGWFADKYPQSINLKDKTHLLITFADNSTQSITLSTNYRNELAKPHDKFSIENDMLTMINSNVNTKLGNIKNTRLFFCDRIHDAIPISDNSFLTIDKNFQLWKWEYTSSYWNRKHITNLNKTPYSLALGKVNGVYCPVALQTNQSIIGKFINNSIDNSVSNLTICEKMGEESGQCQNIKWQHSDAGMELSVSVNNSNFSSALPLTCESNGLCLLGKPRLVGDENSEEPVVVVEQSNGKFGYPINCTNFQDKLSKLNYTNKNHSKLVSKGFTQNGLQFVNNSGTWNILLDGVEIALSNGRFAHDNIKHTAVIHDDNQNILYIASALPGYIVKMIWSKAISTPTLVKLPANSYPTDLRMANNRLYVSIDNQWYCYENNNWQKSDIDWSVGGNSTKWNVTKNKKILANGFEQELIVLNDKIAFESETFTDLISENGYCFAVASENGICYKTLNGKCYEFNIANKTRSKTDTTPNIQNKINNLSIGLSMPERCKTQNTYFINKNGSSQDIHLPLNIIDGRLAHENTTGAIIREKDNAYLVLNTANLCRVHPLDENNISQWKISKNSNELKDSGNAEYEPANKLVLSSNKYIEWWAKDNNHNFFLTDEAADKNSSNHYINLGYITKNGLQIFDHTQIKLISKSDNTIEYAFKNKVFENRGIVRLTELTTSKKYENEKANNAFLLYDANKKDFVISFDLNQKTVGNSFDVVILGRFDNNGQYDSENTWVYKNYESGTGTEFSLMHKALNFEIPFQKNSKGYFTNCEYPVDISVSKDNALCILGKYNNSLCFWQQNDQNRSIANYEVLANKDSISKLHYIDNDLYVMFTSDMAQFCKTTVKPLRKADSATNSIVKGLMLDYFDFTYDLNLKNWVVYFNDSQKSRFALDDYSKLPGIFVERIHYNAQDTVLSDSFAHSIIGSNTRIIWKADNEQFASDIRRCLDKLYIGDSILAYDYSVEPASTTISCNIGSWIYNTNSQHDSLALVGRVGEKEVNILSKSKDSNKTLSIDLKPRALVKSKDGIKIYFEYGLERIDISTYTQLISGLSEGYSLPDGSMQILNNNENVFIKKPKLDYGLRLEDAVMKKLPVDAIPCVYRDNNWLIESVLNGLKFNKKKNYINSNEILSEIPMDKLFTEGQFCFDRVKSVFYNASDGGLFVETDNGYEKIVQKQGEMDKLYDYLPSEDDYENFHKINVKSMRSYADVLIGDDNYSIPEIKFSDKLTEDCIKTIKANKLKPQAFYSCGKCWVVFPNEVRWIEQRLRWEPKLLFYR